MKRQRRTHLDWVLAVTASSLLSSCCISASWTGRNANCLDGTIRIGHSTSSSSSITTAFANVNSAPLLSRGTGRRRRHDQPCTTLRYLQESFDYKTSGSVDDISVVGLHAKKKSAQNKDDDTDAPLDGGDDEIDFPAWVRALRRWPLYPASPSEEELAAVTLEERGSEEGGDGRKPAEEPRSRISIPLASLINVEALLMASGEEIMESATDLEHLESASHMGPTLDLASSDGSSNTSIALMNSTSSMAGSKNATTPLSILPRLEELGNWDQLVGTMQRSLSELPGASRTSAAIGNTTDAILKEATSRLEYLTREASKISPSVVQDLIVRASRAIGSKEGVEAATDLVKVAEKMAREQGMDVKEASAQAKEATKYTANLVSLANDLLVSGFATSKEDEDSETEGKPLFADFSTARSITRSKFKTTVAKAAEMGSLAGAIYSDMIPRAVELGHALVANGTSDDVAWMITDSIMFQDEFQETKSFRQKRERKPIFVRTITLRGFDASDEDVDRELLLNRICSATPERLNDENGVLLHSGLLSIARSIFKDIERYIDATGPMHRFVINGHSVGGSLSVLLLLLMTEARGAEYVREKVLRVFTFGSPPIAVVSYQERSIEAEFDSVSDCHLSKMFGTPVDDDLKNYGCSVLEAFNLPPAMVFQYIQPWDPITRLFTEIDPLYPLIGDIGEDGITPYASGPPRSLRSITRAIIEGWDGWPRFRDNFKNTVNQNYTSIGVQHILLPEPIRYLTDRLVSANVGVPPVDGILRISSKELYPALQKTFPLDVFRISFVLVAIRSFSHHFYPAYGYPMVDYASKRLSSKVSNNVNDMAKQDYERAMNELEEKLQGMDSEEEDEEPGERKEKKKRRAGGGLGWTAPWQSRRDD